MSMEYIRKYYGVPAKRGMKIRFQGIECKILSARGQYLLVQGPTRRFMIHPAWHVEYLEEKV